MVLFLQIILDLDEYQIEENLVSTMNFQCFYRSESYEIKFNTIFFFFFLGNAGCGATVRHFPQFCLMSRHTEKALVSGLRPKCCNSNKFHGCSVEMRARENCENNPSFTVMILLPWPKKMRQARKPNIGACMLDRSRACATCARLSQFFWPG